MAIRILAGNAISSENGYLSYLAGQRLTDYRILDIATDVSRAISILADEILTLKNQSTTANTTNIVPLEKVENLEKGLAKVRALTERWKPVISDLREAKERKQKWLKENR